MLEANIAKHCATSVNIFEVWCSKHNIDPWKSSISGLITNFYTDRPVELNLIPQWDLLVVVDALTKKTFESKDTSSVQLKHLTYKTVFLLSLASGARMGEIHALDISRTRWLEEGPQTICGIPIANLCSQRPLNGYDWV